jgi:predicted porin
MNQKVLAIAMAAALVVPMTSQAEITFSGTIQAEMGVAKQENSNNKDLQDGIRTSEDGEGSVSNGGPNHLRFDITEQLGSGLAAFARYQPTFNTANGSGTGLNSTQESWLGLKGESFYGRFGRMTGLYKASKGLVDPFAGTAIQARGTAGGMTGSTINAIECDAGVGSACRNGATGVHTASTNFTKTRAGVDSKTAALTHSSYIGDVLELGAKFGGFSFAIQGVYDQTASMDGAGLLELKYTAPNFTVFLAGAYADMNLSDTINNVSDSIQGNDDQEDNSGDGNWKIGGQYKLEGLTIGLQYEDAEMGNMDYDINPDGGKYIMGSLAYTMNNVTVGGWVSGYLSDIEDNYKLVVNNERFDEDAINWGLGAIYSFSKRTLVYGGYRQVDSDNDYRDEIVYGVGIRHSF